jgi:hypothetical protein
MTTGMLDISILHCNKYYFIESFSVVIYRVMTYRITVHV